MNLARTIGAVLIPICVGCAALIDLEPGEIDSSSGEGGGVGQPCASDGDCPSSDDCSTWACEDGACAVTVAPDDTPVGADSVVGDCKKNVCKDGDPAVVNDDADFAADNNPCTFETCTNGMKQAGNVPDGTVCGMTGKLSCMNGICQGCSMDPASCDPPMECQTVECPVNTCMYSIADGKVVSDPSDTDCKVEVCDAQENKVIKGDTSEIPPQEGDNCRMEVCAADGNVGQVDANEGGKCADPPGACHNDSVCVAGACSPQPKPGGAHIGDNGVPGDCKATYCDGNGGAVTGNDDADVPGDPNGGNCWVPICTNGAPGQVPIPTGSACSEQVDGKCCGGSCCANAFAGDGQFCDQGGTCCASGKTCGGSCCPSASDACFNDACCGGSICAGECCETQHFCAPDSGSCCPGIQQCPNGSCCPQGKECLADNQCI